MIKTIIKKIPFAKNLIKFSYKNFIFTRNYFIFIKEYFVFKGEEKNKPSKIKWKDRKPMLFEKTPSTKFDPHYTYHPAWVARILNQTHPQKHIDISSMLEFSTMLSAFILVKFYDYRPAKIQLPDLKMQKS